VTSDDPLLRPPPDGVEHRPASAAARLLMGGPVVLVTATWRGQHNVMPLAWHMPLSTDPPLVAIAVEQSRHTVELISHGQEFALNFPGRPLLHHVQYLGALRGDSIDKFEATQLETFAPTHINAPLVAGCAAWVECEVQESLPFGDHVLFVGLVVAVHVDPEAFGDRWAVGAREEVRPLHFVGGNVYSTLARALEAKVPQGFEAPERALAQRLAEELELTREARERREERRAALEREVERGNLVDLDELEDEDEAAAAQRGERLDGEIDLSQGVILGEG